jgi:hypothetical protein
VDEWEKGENEWVSEASSNGDGLEDVRSEQVTEKVLRSLLMEEEIKTL